jgi:hypothetical protein
VHRAFILDNGGKKTPLEPKMALFAGDATPKPSDVSKLIPVMELEEYSEGYFVTA